MKGTIEQIWENKSRNGEKYLTVQMNGSATASGTRSTSTRSRPGQKSNARSARAEFPALGGHQPMTAHEAPATGPNTKDSQISRMSCLKSASEIIAPFPIDLDQKRDLVVCEPPGTSSGTCPGMNLSNRRPRDKVSRVWQGKDVDRHLDNSGPDGSEYWVAGH